MRFQAEVFTYDENNIIFVRNFAIGQYTYAISKRKKKIFKNMNYMHWDNKTSNNGANL